MEIAIVTGATKGIGLEIAQTLRDAGYFVIGTYVRDYDPEFISALQTQNFILKQVDASDYDAVKAFSTEVKKEFGNITVLSESDGVLPELYSPLSLML